MSAAAAASSCTQSRMARSKQPDILLDKSHEQAAVDFMNQVLGDIDPPIECGKLHEMLKDGVLLCKYVYHPSGRMTRFSSTSIYIASSTNYDQEPSSMWDNAISHLSRYVHAMEAKFIIKEGC